MKSSLFIPGLASWATFFHPFGILWNIILFPTFAADLLPDWLICYHERFGNKIDRLLFQLKILKR
jgi:hypothetical protein